MAQKKPQKLFSYQDNQALDKDIRQIYDWLSRLEVVTTNPNGNRKGKYTGEVVLLQTGGNNYIEICTDAGTTTWKGVILTVTP